MTHQLPWRGDGIFQASTHTSCTKSALCNLTRAVAERIVDKVIIRTAELQTSLYRVIAEARWIRL